MIKYEKNMRYLLYLLIYFGAYNLLKIQYLL